MHLGSGEGLRKLKCLAGGWGAHMTVCLLRVVLGGCLRPSSSGLGQSCPGAPLGHRTLCRACGGSAKTQPVLPLLGPALGEAQVQELRENKPRLPTHQRISSRHKRKGDEVPPHQCSLKKSYTRKNHSDRCHHRAGSRARTAPAEPTSCARSAPTAPDSLRTLKGRRFWGATRRRPLSRS